MTRHAAVLVLGACASAAATPGPQGIWIGFIEGRVVTPDRRPAPGVEVEVEGPGTKVLWVPRAVTNDLGRFHLGRVAEGEYQIHASTRSRTASTPARPVAVVRGQTTSVELVLATLDCTGPSPPPAPAHAVVHASIRVPGLVAFGYPALDAGPEVFQVAFGPCVGDSDLDRAELLRRAGWDRATPAEREVLAAAWVADVIYAFRGKAAGGLGVSYVPPAGRTLPDGMIAVESWQDVGLGLPSYRPRRERIEWRFGPDADLHGPVVLEELPLPRDR
jgi:hypothetical protein